jgi:hypothetical protein
MEINRQKQRGNFLVAFSAHSLRMKMDAVRSSETSMNFYRSTRSYFSESSNLHAKLSKSRKSVIFFARSQALPVRPSDNGRMEVKWFEWLEALT